MGLKVAYHSEAEIQDNSIHKHCILRKTDYLGYIFFPPENPDQEHFQSCSPKHASVASPVESGV